MSFFPFVPTTRHVAESFPSRSAQLVTRQNKTVRHGDKPLPPRPHPIDALLVSVCCRLKQNTPALRHALLALFSLACVRHCWSVFIFGQTHTGLSGDVTWSWQSQNLALSPAGVGTHSRPKVNSPKELEYAKKPGGRGEEVCVTLFSR